ncbi:MAG: DNA translocase FtsK 4TM domain-containing protein, partial [Polyangiaceae bacterium]|nr:DNA translocase FtsK 4TM domain-containing protein [Polyangiaceae bacterium]
MRKEVAALVFWTSSLLFGLSLASHRVIGEGVLGENWIGPVGNGVAFASSWAFGVVAWVFPLELFLLGIPFIFGKGGPKALHLLSDIVFAVILASLVQIGFPAAKAFGEAHASGAIGELFGELARSLFSTVGSTIIGISCAAMILIARAAFSFIKLVQVISAFGSSGASKTANSAKEIAAAWKTAKELEIERAEKEKQLLAPRIAVQKDEATIAALLEDVSATDDSDMLPDDETIGGPTSGKEHAAKDLSVEDALSAPPRPLRKSKGTQAGITSDKVESTLADVAEDLRANALSAKKPDSIAEKKPLEKKRTGDADAKAYAREVATKGSSTKDGLKDNEAVKDKTSKDANGVKEAKAEQTKESLPTEEASLTHSTPSDNSESAEKKAKKAKPGPVGPTIVDTSSALAVEAPVEPPKRKERFSSFVFPSFELLSPAKIDPTLTIDRDQLLQTADVLVRALADHTVEGRVEDILPGPTVTTFEVSPKAGTKVSKIAGLENDLALALARKVRIIAPIPGKSRVGFEVPNERRVPVNLRELIEDRRFQTLDVPLPVVLGRDIVGSPVYADLASMPHVIVAGATGAGKSVGLNVMLTSLLFRRAPSELRLLMIDPKVVELAPFDRIPHMLLPVVTDMKQAANALKWAVDEMERRYQLFADAGTKNLATYNQWTERVCRGEVKNPLPKKVVGLDHNRLPDEAITTGSDGVQEMPEKLPFIVIVVDEFADLMMQQGKDVETAVARLAQKARAAGMHVILATQRPSVDVITGMIKANFPTRIAFRVAQSVDSKTILDELGAQHLLGKGDMLVKLNGTNETKRVQCPWVSEDEVNAINDHLRAQGEPVYDENILKPRDEDGNTEDE